jgi:ABC-type glycerol-3-phosphate transport system substrate-binding protein
VVEASPQLIHFPHDCVMLDACCLIDLHASGYMAEILAAIGIINALLVRMGWPTFTWLEDPLPFAKRLFMFAGVENLDWLPNLAAGPSTAIIVVIVYSIWTSLGYNIVIQGFSCFATFWNADMLQAAGMDMRPASWDDFPDQVRAVSAANDGVAGWLIGGAGDRFISCLLTYGVSWLKEGGEESDFDAPEALEIMTWWRQLSDEGLLAVPAESARDAFQAQQSVYYMDRSANSVRFQTTVADFGWAAAAPPQRHGGETVTETYGPVNTVPKTSAKEQVAGWKFIKWLLSPEVHARWVQQTSYFSSTRSAVETEALQSFYTTNPVARQLIEEAMTLDIAHLHIAAHDMGFDYLDAVAEAAPWVRHLHANDNFGKLDTGFDNEYER